MEQGKHTLEKKVTEILLFMHLTAALIILGLKNILASVIMLGIYSILSSLLFFTLHAPDVALTEAAVGAGVTTFLFIWVIKKTNCRIKS